MPPTKKKKEKILKNKSKDDIIVKIINSDITQINMGWRHFEIQWKERIYYEGNSCHGLSNWDTGTVTIDPRLDNELAKETILHEITHLLLENVGLGGGEDDSGIQMKNEDVTALLSRGMMQLWILNPELMSIIFGAIIITNGPST